MEVIAFNTSDVENKLYDIKSAFHAMKFAVNGLRTLDLISNNDLNGLMYILKDACDKS